MRNVLFVFIVMFAFPAYAGWVEALFPSLRVDDTKPTADGRAPFAAKEDTVVNKPKNSLAILKDEAEKKGVDLDQPHLLSEDISQWVDDAVSLALNVDGAAAQKAFIVDERIFTKGGREQYLTFLQEKNVQKVIDDGRFKVVSYVEDVPLLINEGAVNGVYRWLYRVPVVMSYMDRNMKSYQNSRPVTQKASIEVQVGRSVSNVNDAGLLIERWSGTLKPFKEASR